MNDEERKQRNYVIAGAIGGFLLPLVGIVGALVFYSRGQPDAGRTLVIAAVAGTIAYLILFGAL
jgi:uncharacterized membrane protein (GlpM family)